MSLIINSTNHDDQDDSLPISISREYNFYVNEKLLSKSLSEILTDPALKQSIAEETITITYIPKSVFRVRSVSRCAAEMSGHTQPVLTASFSPNGRILASGSGDCSVRIWDVNTHTPRHTLTGHSGWVQHVLFSPDCLVLASAGMDGSIRLWDPVKGTLLGTMVHGGAITGMSFEPMCANAACTRLATASKDGTVKVWDIARRVCLGTLAGHVGPVMCVKWSGNGRIYSGGRDKMVKMWEGGNEFPKFLGNLSGHGHWVNSLAMMSDFVCRSGPYDHTDPKFATREEAHLASVKRYKTFLSSLPSQQDILATCSDDFTIILWSPLTTTKPLARLTGHQQAVNHLTFSPNGHILATASFDKSIKLWNAFGHGTFLATLRGHVGAVYQVCFSSDSRKLVSASRDSTCKVWDVEGSLQKGKHVLVGELNGHCDEVWCVDWACDGSGCVSGGKDKTLRIWKH